MALLLLPGCERNIKEMSTESFTNKFRASILSAFATGRVYVAESDLCTFSIIYFKSIWKLRL